MHAEIHIQYISYLECKKGVTDKFKISFLINQDTGFSLSIINPTSLSNKPEIYFVYVRLV